MPVMTPGLRGPLSSKCLLNVGQAKQMKPSLLKHRKETRGMKGPGPKVGSLQEHGQNADGNLDWPHGL